MKKVQGWAVFSAIILFIAVFLLSALALREVSPTTPSVIYHGNTLIGTEQYVNKIIVVNGLAEIAGQVDKVAVIGGDLKLVRGSAVNEALFVMAGRLEYPPGYALPSTIIVIQPQSSAKYWSVLLAGGFVVALLAIVMLPRVVFKLYRSTSLYWSRRQITVPRYRWPALYALFGLLVSGVLLALFVHLAEETIYLHEVDVFDNAVIWLVRSIANADVDSMMISVTYFGSGYIFSFLGPLILGFLVIIGRRREGAVLAICLAGASVLNILLKNLFERARPDFFQVVSATGYSFPSGHAMISFCFYGMLAYILERHVHSPVIKSLIYIAAAGLVVMIGISRIYLGVHYPSDVLAGFIAGATWLSFCVSLLWWWETKR